MVTIGDCWVSRGILGAPTKIDFSTIFSSFWGICYCASPIRIYRSCTYMPCCFFCWCTQAQPPNSKKISQWKWLNIPSVLVEMMKFTRKQVRVQPASLFECVRILSLCNKKDWSNEIVHLICHDVQTSRMVRGSTCRCSVGYTWSQVVSFNWIMAMIGRPTFTIWEHGKKSKICLGIIFTAPRDEYAPHGSMWK